MKLAPRERRPRPDYLVDHADQLRLGTIFLRWGKKKTYKKKDTTTAKTANVVKPAPMKEAAAAPKTSKKSAPTPVKRSPPTPVKKSPPKPPLKKSAPTSVKAAPSRSPSVSHAKTLPVKKAVTPPVSSHHKKTATPVKKKSAFADIREASPAVTTPKRVAPVKTVPTPVVQRTWSTHGRSPFSARGLPPVIPNPVPTPALPACDIPDSTAQGPTITVTVRTMNNISFRIIALAETKLYELKRQIIDLIAAIGPAPQYCPQLPLLVMNGRALAPDHATLSALGFATNATVYCFPEVA